MRLTQTAFCHLPFVHLHLGLKLLSYTYFAILEQTRSIVMQSYNATLIVFNISQYSSSPSKQNPLILHLRHWPHLGFPYSSAIGYVLRGTRWKNRQRNSSSIGKLLCNLPGFLAYPGFLDCAAPVYTVCLSKLPPRPAPSGEADSALPVYASIASALFPYMGQEEHCADTGPRP
jgi:hypothetical protein